MQFLMIVESPIKAKTISGYLLDQPEHWTVMATGGHIVNLPENEHGVTEKDAKFEGKWVLESGKSKIVKSIAAAAAASDNVYRYVQIPIERAKVSLGI